MDDSINDALIECVKAAGGSKVAGAALWPAKPLIAAQRLLLDCLSEDRPQRLAPEQVLLIARMARERGCHAYAQFLARELSYGEPVPLKPLDEEDQLRRQLLEVGRDLQHKLARLESIERGSAPVLRSAG